MWFAGWIKYDIVLRIYWEDQDTPSVEVPLPAFFAHMYCSDENSDGCYPTLNSAMVMVAPKQGYSCYWEMPFRKHCRITLENLTEGHKGIYYQINYTLTEIPDDCAYFHAQYRQKRPVDYMEEYVILDGVEGKGHYVGTSLAAGMNGSNNWWGEGEFKFYIDDDSKFPTICGTGLEDYFLGAWGWVPKVIMRHIQDCMRECSSIYIQIPYISLRRDFSFTAGMFLILSVLIKNSV